ncbi:MAG: AraC family transcriptional regulator [Rhizobacter sp.]|nr:AraC family transcriptional regulator [Rhizobacter sp.]
MADARLDSTSVKAPTAAAARRATATGRVHFWPGGSVWIGRGEGRTEWHEHHALQIALALDGACLFRSEGDGGWTEFAGALVGSHRRHQFEVDGAPTLAHVFVEPESAEGRALLARLGDAALTALPDHEQRLMAEALRQVLHAPPHTTIAAARAAVALLAGVPLAAEPVDPRVLKAIAHARAQLQAGVTLASAAEAAALSPGRLRHLFVRETGTGFRVYLLWLRINAAIESAAAGRSWTDAAHEAGFADSAHLTRTFKRMFGLNPASLVPR